MRYKNILNYYLIECPFIPYNDGCDKAQYKPLRTMQTCLTQMLGNKLGEC